MILGFVVVTYILWSFHIVERVFSHVYLWQLKEYRWDRMWAYLREGSVLSKIGGKTKAAVVFGLITIALNPLIAALGVIPLLGYLIHFGFFSLLFLRGVQKRTFTRPKVSIRNGIILGLSGIVMMVPLLCFYLSVVSVFGDVDVGFELFTNVKLSSGIVNEDLFQPLYIFLVTLVGIDLLLPGIVSVFVMVSSVFARFIRERKIRQATAKIRQIENLKVIGITGSYGKSTTKEILKHILRERFKTFATQKNINTDIGVALAILNNLDYLVDVFIVEMGAYKRGEIKKMCDIVAPDVAVLTGINEQHIALFGDLERTLRAKYEIVENAKEDATVVMNGDSDMVLRVAGKSQKKELLYSTNKELDVWASDIKSKDDHVEFNVYYKGDVKRFEVRMLGEHNISNILAATSVALSLEMNLGEIGEILKRVSKTRKIGKLTTKKSVFGYRIIDDSYNSNPAGFDAALDVLSKTTGGKKIVVTIGILELGGEAKSVYKRLSKKIVASCDTLVTTDERLQTFVKEADPKMHIVFDTGIEKQLAFLRNEVSKDDVVLFEGPNLRLMEEVLGKKVGR